MMRSLWISKTGMEAQQTQLDTISNNLANVSSNGYKRSHAVFEDLMYQNLRQAGANTSEQTTLPTGLQVGLGTRAVATSRTFTQGNLQQSTNNLDIAVLGNGFFEVQMPDGTTGYTRDGALKLDSQGQLVTNNGYAVQPGITIPSTAQSVTIGSDGTVSVTVPGQSAPQTVGQLNIRPRAYRGARRSALGARKPQRRLPGWVMRLIASARVAGFDLKSPRTADVTVSEPGFFTPRIDMQKCSASMTTSTPRGSRHCSMASAIWVVNRSWTCGRFE